MFHYQADLLHCENLSVEAVARQVGTPFYCYSAEAIRTRFREYTTVFEPDNALICYAVKANSNPSVLGLLAEMGSGADVVSAGELHSALAAGIPASKIVFSGVGKTVSEMNFALERGIFQFNVESEPELERLNQLALSVGKPARVSIRVNPDIDARTHRKITTGKSENKFGIPASRAIKIYDQARQLKGIETQGISMHIGSQLTRLRPFEQAFNALAALTVQLRAAGHDIRVLDIGGGLGIDYGDGHSPPPLERYARLARQILDPLGCRLIIEPGRSLLGAAGILVTEIQYVKQGQERTFLIVDAGMNHLLRPALYDAWHDILPVRKTQGTTLEYDVVGPICETGDSFATKRRLSPMTQGDLLAVMNTGAYGAVMGSFYNSHPLAPEVLIDQGEFRIVRKRMGLDQLIAMDS